MEQKRYQITIASESPQLIQLDGIGMKDLEEQPQMGMIERQDEDMLRHIATSTYEKQKQN